MYARGDTKKFLGKNVYILRVWQTLKNNFFLFDQML
jgi:hypothetical protein